MGFDIEILGKGFYAITHNTDAGKEWMYQVDGFDGIGTYCDDARLVQDIADGAVNDGLIVGINGRQYLGSNRVAA
ncbi:MAG TPA: hypothetical protein VI386_17830 [Candidatus Sulfotelmatobacter sp.]